MYGFVLGCVLCVVGFLCRDLCWVCFKCLLCVVIFILCCGVLFLLLCVVFGMVMVAFFVGRGSVRFVST